MCAPSGTSARASSEPNSAAASSRVADRPDADVLVAEVLEPLVERARARRSRRARPRAPPGPSSYWRSASSGRSTSSQSRGKNFGSSAPTVRWRPSARRVDPVAGEPAREHARHRLAAEPVRDEVVRAVGHRDDDARAGRPCARARGARRGPASPRRARRRRGRRSGSAGAPGAVSSRTPAQPR